MAKNNYKIIALLLLSFSFSCDSGTTTSQVGGPSEENYNRDRDTVVPTFIYDGDTFKFFKEGYGNLDVRILDLDTYETQPGKRLQEQADRNNISIAEALDLGEEAKEWAKQNILGKEIVIFKIFSRNTDSYDRLLRKVEINGKSYDSIMRVNGWDTGL